MQKAVTLTCFIRILHLKSLLTDDFTTLRFKKEFKFCLVKKNNGKLNKLCDFSFYMMTRTLKNGYLKSCVVTFIFKNLLSLISYTTFSTYVSFPAVYFWLVLIVTFFFCVLPGFIFFLKKSSWQNKIIKQKIEQFWLALFQSL